MSTQQKKKKKNNSRLYILIAAVVLLIVMIVLIAAKCSGGKEKTGRGQHERRILIAVTRSGRHRSAGPDSPASRRRANAR